MSSRSDHLSIYQLHIFPEVGPFFCEDARWVLKHGKELVAMCLAQKKQRIWTSTADDDDGQIVYATREHAAIVTLRTKYSGKYSTLSALDKFLISSTRRLATVLEDNPDEGICQRKHEVFSEHPIRARSDPSPVSVYGPFAKTYKNILLSKMRLTAPILADPSLESRLHASRWQLVTQHGDPWSKDQAIENWAIASICGSSPAHHILPHKHYPLSSGARLRKIVVDDACEDDHSVLPWYFEPSCPPSPSGEPITFTNEEWSKWCEEEERFQ